MRDLKIEVRNRQPLHSKDGGRYQFEIFENATFPQLLYRRHDAELGTFLNVLADFFGDVKPEFISLVLKNSPNWMLSKQIDDTTADHLFALLPSRTCIVRFAYRMLTSGFQLTCLPYGGLTAPEHPSELIRPSLKELVAALEKVDVHYPGDQIDPALGMVVKLEDLLSFGLKLGVVSGFCGT